MTRSFLDGYRYTRASLVTPPANAGDAGLKPRSGRSPEEGNGILF